MIVRRRECCNTQTNTYHRKGCPVHMKWLQDHGVTRDYRMTYAPLCGEDLDPFRLIFAAPLDQPDATAEDATFENEFKVHRQESGQ